MIENILDKIVKVKTLEVESRKINNVFPEYICNTSRSFYNALKKGGPSIIAEVKRSSPSRGLIRVDFDVEQIASVYRHYARAVSVLTDSEFFGGSHEFLKIVSDRIYQPVLCKDFIIDKYQIYEARSYGAHAILLIVAILTDSQIRDFLKISHSLGMDCLVEVHDEAELERALRADAR
ncbi:MAG: indole-3-glycerol phosphate synthase TrpC, partial [Candidatus Muiribacteriaceae bacterium]